MTYTADNARALVRNRLDNRIADAVADHLLTDTTAELYISADDPLRSTIIPELRKRGFIVADNGLPITDGYLTFSWEP